MGLVLVLLPLLLRVPGGWTGEFNNAPREQIRNDFTELTVRRRQ